MKNWKPRTWAASAVLLALSVFLLRQCAPVDLVYRFYMNSRVDDAISLLETDPTAFRSETRDAVRIVAAAAAENHVNSPEASFILAVQYEREGDYESAEQTLLEAIQNAPEWSWPYVTLGILLARYGHDRLDEAEELLLRAVSLQPDWVRPYNSLGVVLRLQGRLDEAEAVSRQALELAPYDVAAHNNYANLLVVQGRYEEAEQHYFFAMESEPENAKPPYNLACLFSVSGDYEQALTYLETAIALSETARLDAAIDPYFDPMRSLPEFQSVIYGEAFSQEGEHGENDDGPVAHPDAEE